jgi:hypothetical protein
MSDDEWLYPGDPAAPFSGRAYMDSLRSRPDALNAFLRSVARRVLRPGSREARRIGRDAFLADAVSDLWTLTTNPAFQSALDSGSSVLQMHGYLSRSLARECARTAPSEHPASSEVREPATDHPEDDPALVSAARDLVRLFRRRLPEECLELLAARIGLAPNDGEEAAGWTAVERFLSLSSGTRKRQWDRVLEVMERILEHPAIGIREMLLALRLLAEEARGEARRGEARRGFPLPASA